MKQKERAPASAQRKNARQIAVADCETDPFKFGRIPQPFLWGFYDGKDYLEFKTTKDFVEYVKGLDIIIYAHNGGKFDWHFIKEYIEAYQDVMIISGRLASFKIGKAEFRDSYSLIPLPLAAYQKTEIDYGIFEKNEREKPENWKEIRAYLKDDCIFLYEIVAEFIESFGLNLTLASSALKYWKKHFQKKANLKGTRWFYDEFKKYYYGGRVECFTKGEINENFVSIDINSAYPYAMLSEHVFGYGVDYQTEIPKENPERAFYTVDAISRGAFPFREKSGLTFPNDGEIRRYSVTGWELMAAIETGTVDILNYVEIAVFRESINFKGYVNHFYELKKESKNKDKAKYLMAKLFLNSLYGKFGANPTKYRKHETIDAQYISAAVEHGDMVLNGFMSENVALMARELDEEEMRFFNVATAASVTGFVRAYLWRALCDVSAPLYCDTDSIACKNSGNLTFGDKLGEWEKEGEYEKGAICGKKLYAFKEKGKNVYKIASKGVKLSHKDIFAIANGKEVLYKNSAPTFSLKKETVFLERKIKLT